jgi:hypothetical protein
MIGTQGQSYTSNARFYQDATGSIQNMTSGKLERLNDSMNNTINSHTVINNGSNLRPITRDIKVRSNSKGGPPQKKQVNNYSQQQNYNTNIMNTNGSAMSGGGSGVKTF